MGIGCARCESMGKKKNIYQKMYGKAGSNIRVLLNIKINVNKLLKIAVQEKGGPGTGLSTHTGGSRSTIQHCIALVRILRIFF